MKVLYPGTFDPLTFGHIDIINRAKHIFGMNSVVVGIAANARKNPLFSVEERMEFIGKHCQPVTVATYEGLTVSFCRNKKINVIIRGVRNQLDFEYEYPIACANKDLEPGIETVFIMSDPSISYVSSSMVKEIVSNRGLVTKFVPEDIAEALEEKLLYE